MAEPPDAPSPEPKVRESAEEAPPVPAPKPELGSPQDEDRDPSALDAAAAAPENPGGSGDGHSSQLLAVAEAASPAASPRAEQPVLTDVPPDAELVSVAAVPCVLPPPALLGSSAFEGQFTMTHQAALATVTAHAQMQLQSAFPSSSPEMAKSQPARVVLKEALSDAYNWRKYGQKQVKSSDRLRSYYKCTLSNCSAKKKVEHCQDGRVTEIIYSGVHNHSPPEKYKCFKEKMPNSGGLTGELESVDVPSKELHESDLSVTKLEQTSVNKTPEQHLHCSSDCEEDAGSRIKNDHDDEPESKRRLSQSIMPYSSAVLKTIKEPKIVVHRACDVGLASDGYRWRKYGQKIVKGNPNPRSYYRCTHNGCPVRKHVERASEDAMAMVITYEGKHNHDLPTPKSGDDPSPAALPASAAVPEAAVATVEQQQPSAHPSGSPTHDVNCAITRDNAMDLDEEKELESSQALLSMAAESTSPGEVGESSVRQTIFREDPAALTAPNT